MPDQILTFFAALFGIKRSRMLIIEMLHMENIYDDICTENDMNENSDIDISTDENTGDVERAIHNQHNQLHCLFQIIYNQLSHFKKTPLTTSYGQYQYGKSRSREVLTTTNHIGVSCSYTDVRFRKLLVA